MKNILSLLIISLFLFSNCSNDKSVKTNSESLEANSAEIANRSGALTFKKFCASCHQTNGGGVPGMYPPIIDTKKVNGSKDELIGIILNGMSGEIEVKGEIYNNVMPSHSHLTDNQIADLLTYIRSNFGNSSEAITTDEVKKVRETILK